MSHGLVTQFGCTDTVQIDFLAPSIYVPSCKRQGGLRSFDPHYMILPLVFLSKFSLQRVTLVSLGSKRLTLLLSD